MCKLRGILWYIIHANRMLLKIWPHLTFGWPFVDISLTMHPTHSKLYIFVILLTSRVIWYTWKVIWSIMKIWPQHDPCMAPTGKGPNHPKFCQNILWLITTLKPSTTRFRQNGTWVILPLQSSIACTIIFFMFKIHQANNHIFYSLWIAKTTCKNSVNDRQNNTYLSPPAPSFRSDDF